ncbi:Not1-domain-containing protein [Perkinsela sp. CCAP 1560/4]|nr:Not1-domain-containing protein [Perkinsela sp. CCAP 1560/4]|eukprot:KNH06802.1 Not1-domain-containing protein [Perkinsela sp. CCAP 1560/4]
MAYSDSAAETVTNRIFAPLFADEVSAQTVSDVQNAFEIQRTLHQASARIPMSGLLKVLKSSLTQADKARAAAGLRGIFVAEVQHHARSSFIEATEMLRNAFPVEATPKASVKVAQFESDDASDTLKGALSKWRTQPKSEAMTMRSLIENEASWIMTLIRWTEWSFLDRAVIALALANSDSEKASFMGLYALYTEVVPYYTKGFMTGLDPEILGFLVNALERPIVDSPFITGTEIICDADIHNEMKLGIYSDYEQIVSGNIKSSSKPVDLDVCDCLHQMGSHWTREELLEKFFRQTIQLGGLSKASIAEALWSAIADDFSPPPNRAEKTEEQRDILKQYFPSTTATMTNTDDPTWPSSHGTVDFAKHLVEALVSTMGEIDWESVFRAFDMPSFRISDWVVYERLCMIIDFCLTKTTNDTDGEHGPITREAIERRILLHCEWANQLAQVQWMRFAFFTSQDGVQRKWYTDEAIMSTLLTVGRNPTMRHVVCQVFHSECLDVLEASTESTFSTGKIELLTCLFHHAKGKNTSLCCILIADLFRSATAMSSDHAGESNENRILSFIDTISTEFTQSEYMHHTIPTDDQSRWMHTLAVSIVHCMRKGTITTSQLSSIIKRVHDPAFIVEVLSEAPAATAIRVFLTTFEERNYQLLREWMANTFFEPQRAENYLDPGWFIYHAAQWAQQWLHEKPHIAERKEMIHAIIGILGSPFAVPSSLPRLRKLQVSLREALRERHLFDTSLLLGTTQLLDENADVMPRQADGHLLILSYPASRDLTAEEYQRKQDLQAKREMDDLQMAEEVSAAMIQQLFAGKLRPDEFLLSFADIKHRGERQSRDLLQEVADRKSSTAVPWQKPLNHRQAKKLYDTIVDVIWKECPKFSDYPAKEQDIAVSVIGRIILYDLFPKASGETKTITALLKFVLQNIGKPKKPSARKFAIRVLSQFLSRIPQWPHYCKHLHALLQCEPIGKELRENIPTIELTLKENERDDSAEAVARTEREWNVATMMLDRRSIGKRLSLLDESGLVLPSVGVRQRVAFLLNNLDCENVPQHALEMSPLLDTPPTALLYFARYLVEKRVLCEPNYHKAYSSLLTRIGNRVFEKMVLAVSYCSIERCLENDSIRTSSSERSTLKNLGSWIGIITLSKDRPVIARELNIQSLLLDGLANGKLIAIVPFVSKLLEGISSSRVFTIQSPWILSIFVILIDLYSLSNIKVNLRFELELLCKKINVSLGDLVTLCAAHSARNAIRSAVEELYRCIDFASSVDFTMPVAQPPAKSGSKAMNKHGMDAQRQKQPHMSGAKDFRNIPRTAQTVSAPIERIDSSMKQEPQATMQQNWMENLDIIQSLIPPFRLPTNISAFLASKGITLSAGSPKLNEAVPSVIASILKLAVEVAVKEVLLPVVERSVLIATSTTRELIRKDFAFDTDDQALEKHLKAMARALASSLAVVTAKEPLRASTRRTLQSSIHSSFAVAHSHGGSFTTVGHEDENKGTLPPAVLQEFIDLILQDNKEGLGVLELVERVAAESAVNRITEVGIAFAEERRQSRRLLLAMGANAVPNTALHPHPFTATLPRELLVNNGIQGPTKDIYVEFTGFTVLRGPLSESSNPEKTLTKVLEQLNSLVAYIETEAVKHYKNYPRQYMSLTQKEFASSTLSNSHENIKKCLYIVPDLVKMVVEEADLLQLVQFTFRNLVSITNSMNSTAVSSTEIIQRIQRKGQDDEPPLPTGALILNLIHESYLLILQSAMERQLPHKQKDQAGNASNRVIAAITRLFLDDEQLWELKDLCIGFIRLRLIEVSLLDVHIQRALTELLEDKTGLFDSTERPLKYTPRARAIVEFAGGLVQSCLVDEKIASQKDLQGTLRALAAAASEAQRQQKALLRSSVRKPSAPIRIPTYFPQHVTKNRVFVWDILENWRQALKKWSAQDNVNSADVLRATVQKGFATGKRPLHPENYVTKFIERLTDKCAGTPDLTAKAFFQLSIEAAVADCATQSPVDGGFSDADKLVKSRPLEAIDALSEMVIAISFNDHRFWNTSQGGIFAGFFEALNSVMQANHHHFVDAGKFSQHEAASGPYPSSRDAVPQHEFQQQPYFRLVSNLLCAHQLAKGESQESQFQTFMPHLVGFLQANFPSAFPGFTFSWVSLVFHRVVLPSLVLPSGPAKCNVPSSSSGILPGWKSMKELLTMLVEFLVQITSDHHGQDDCFPPHIALLYTNTLRGFLVLLHDFPEFLCVYADSLCSMLPVHFVQMRNIILSAFPRTIRLPDPFTPNLKVDLLPESSQAPFVEECVQNTLRSTIVASNDNLEKDGSVWDLVQSILRQRSKAFSAVQRIISASKDANKESTVISASVLSICLLVVRESANKPKESVAVSHDGLVILQMLAVQLDRKGRFIMLNALVDQLRYPNRLTLYCSFVLLGVFSLTTEEIQRVFGSNFTAESAMKITDLQEQMTRVLFQRLIGNRPHPWGLLITFIELVKNPRYEFWKKSYVHNSTPALKKLFESVGHSCARQTASDMTVSPA